MNFFLSNCCKYTKCSSFKQLYFVFPDNTAVDVCVLRVPVTCLQQLGNYRVDVKQNGMPIAGVITKISFDPEADYSKPIFSFVKILPEKQYLITTKLSQIPDVSQLRIDVGDAPLAQVENKTEAPATPPGEDKMSNQVNFSNITLKTVDYCIYLGKDTKFVKGVYLSLSLLQN